MPYPSGSQTVGPFFKFALHHDGWDKFNAPLSEAEAIRITGTVYDGDHEPIPDAFVEFRQARPDGTYRSDPSFIGFGRASTDYEGVYHFTTVMPGRVESSQGLQAPHLAIAIFARGLLKQLVTRIYFSDRDAENAGDPVLRAIGDAAVRQTLIAQRVDQATITTYQFDIVLQGEGETAFFGP
jgi:protocatechuate 3,4-dioxygenase, alpha subunit